MPSIAEAHPRTIKAVEPPFPSLSSTKHIVLVLSGKGGVGKSSVTTQLALSLALKHGKKVGVLDIDLTGPSAPRMFGLQGKQIMQSRNGWVPPYADAGNKNVAVMSVQFLLPNEDDPIVWRGPKKNAMIKQFLQDVVWGPLDYLIIDTPPGTSDEHISVVEYLLRNTQTAQASLSDPNGTSSLQSTGPIVTSVLVTTPQKVALSDVRKEYNFAKTVGLPVLGVVENMSGFVCPCCGDVTPIFSAGGGAQLAQEYNIEFLGSVPVDPTLVTSIEGSTAEVRQAAATQLDQTQPAANESSPGGVQVAGETFVDRFPKSPLWATFGGIAEKVMAGLGDRTSMS